jgi:hypothetical protein
MTPRARFLALVRRKLAGEQPAFVSAFLRSLSAIMDAMPAGQLHELLRAGAVDRLLSLLMSDQAIDAAFAPLRLQVAHAVQDGATFFGRRVPKVPIGQVRSVFGVLNPRVIEAIRTAEGKVMARLRPLVRESVRGIVEGGLTAGESPRTTALRLRKHIGLGAAELQQVDNFRDALMGRNGRRWQDYAKRDPRWDGVVSRALAGDGLTAEQVDKMVDAYARRRLALSAEANARTAMLDSYRQAQATSWQAAIDAGYVDADGLRKEWMTVQDSRVRDTHRALNGVTVPFEAPYPNGQMIPGDTEWNCRCWSRMFVGRT